MQDNRAHEIFFSATQTARLFNLKGASERKALLRKLRAELIRRKDEAVAALEADFGKPRLETVYSEIYVCVNEINYAIRHLHRWVNPKRAGFRLNLPGTSAYITPVPKGCVLIIAPWNYPINLSLIPVINAIAAGNVVVLKTSTLVPATNQFLNELLKSAFPEGEVIFADSDLELSKALTRQPFDHIFFTGSLEAGKSVMRAAAEIPCPVTLELGGRCPAIVHSPVDMKDAARRIVWAKWLNGGQTCVAINHVLVHEPVKKEFTEALKAEMERAFEHSGNSDRASIAHVIDVKNWRRLCDWTDEALKSGANVLYGNNRHESDTYFSPTLMENLPEGSSLLTEEIFGPVLPIVTYTDWDVLLEQMRKERPLAIVLFSNDKRKQQELFLQTRSGSFCINDVIAQFYHTGIPFGGVGSSGFGSYHGYYGFSEFSHFRPVIRRRLKTNWILLALQPYSKWKQKVATFILRYF